MPYPSKREGEKIDSDLCVICHAYGSDKRYLRIRCLYAVDEVVPELSLNGDFYEGWICKSCRGSLLGKMQEWRNERIKLRELVKDHDGYVDETQDSSKNIPVRIHGVIVMMSEDEFKSYKSKPHA